MIFIHKSLSASMKVKQDAIICIGFNINPVKEDTIGLSAKLRENA